MCAYLTAPAPPHVTFVKKPVILTVTRFSYVAAMTCAAVWVQVGKKWNNVALNLSVLTLGPLWTLICAAS